MTLIIVQVVSWRGRTVTQTEQLHQNGAIHFIGRPVRTNWIIHSSIDLISHSTFLSSYGSLSALSLFAHSSSDPN